MNSFERDVISSINQFRSKPKSIDHDLELVRKGLSRLRPNDPFLTEIDTFIKQLQSLKPMNKCEYNETLSQIAKQEVKKFTRDEKYNKYRDSSDLRSIIPKEYQNQDTTNEFFPSAFDIHVLIETINNEYNLGLKVSIVEG